MASRKQLPGQRTRDGALVVKDPEVHIGPFKLLQRTDGPWVAYDARRGLGDRAAFTDKERDKVTAWMKEHQDDPWP